MMSISRVNHPLRVAFINKKTKKMIEYLYQEGVKSEDMKEIKVRLDGKVCGSIKPTDGGWHYIPKGQPTSMAGDTYKTIGQVQRSLADD